MLEYQNSIHFCSLTELDYVVIVVVVVSIVVVIRLVIILITKLIQDLPKQL